MRFSRRSRPTGPFTRVLTLVIAVLFAGGVYLWRMSRLPPSWWAPQSAETPEVRTLAEKVEYRLAEETHRVRPDDAPWRLRIREDQVNAWLAARLPSWLAHAQGLEWPQGVGLPQVHFGRDALFVGVAVEVEGQSRYLSATVRPRLVDDRLELDLQGVSLGRLRLPGGSVQTVVRRLESALPGDVRERPAVRGVLDLLGETQTLAPVFELGDGRRLRLRDVGLENGELVVEVQTQ